MRITKPSPITEGTSPEPTATTASDAEAPGTLTRDDAAEAPTEALSASSEFPAPATDPAPVEDKRAKLAEVDRRIAEVASAPETQERNDTLARLHGQRAKLAPRDIRTTKTPAADGFSAPRTETHPAGSEPSGRSEPIEPAPKDEPTIKLRRAKGAGRVSILGHGAFNEGDVFEIKRSLAATLGEGWELASESPAERPE